MTVSKFACRHRVWPCTLLFIAAVLGVFVLVSQALVVAGLPDYGTWTGLRPIEAKLRLLNRFAQDGPVDAVVLGSSIADTGFSGERYSELMSAHLGRSYRAFNFSTGGAEVATLPNLYRLMRTVAVPRTLLLVTPAGIRRGEGLLPHMPDSTLARAPVHRTLKHKWLLNVDRHLWELPVVRFASPVRDRILYGSYVGLQTQTVDFYRLSKFGDRLVYGFEGTIPEIARLRGIFEEQLAEPVGDGADVVRYFNDTDLEAMDELRALADADSVEILIIAHAPAATLSERPSQDLGYRRRRAAFFTSMAAALRAPLVNPLDDLWVPQYATADTNHINVYGALLFTELATRAMLGRDPIPGSVDAALARRDWPTPDLSRIRSEDRSLNNYAGVVLRERPGQGSTLTMEFVQDHARRRIPDGQLYVSLRLPDNVDIMSPAMRVSDDAVRASFPDLPAEPDQVFLARVVRHESGQYVAPGLPLSRYIWSSP